MGRCTIIITREPIDGVPVWHLSISTPNASPSYKEIKQARYHYLPDNLDMAQIFPPKAEFVNLHPFCHHLWEISIKVDTRRISNVMVGGVDTRDAPDFVDAYIESADYMDREMTEREMEWVSDNAPEFINDWVHQNYGR